MAKLSSDVRTRMQQVHEGLAKTAYLYNFELAVSVRTAKGEPALWIPVQPTPREGGRPSVYDLPINRETLMGTYVTGRGIVHELMTRTAEDDYQMRQVTSEGDVQFKGTGKIEVLNADVGHGQILFTPTSGEAPPARVIWWVWSCIKKSGRYEFFA